jgi:hypothetical protein
VTSSRQPQKEIIMNKSMRLIFGTVAVALVTLATGAAQAETFPYRNLEIDKPPPLTAPDPGDVTFTPKPGAMVVAPLRTMVRRSCHGPAANGTR